MAAAVAGAIAGESDPAIPLGGAELKGVDGLEARYGDTEIDTLVFAGGDCTDLAAPLRPGSFSGTGDLFVSVFTGGLLRGRAPAQAAKQAVDFLSHAIAVTHGTDPRAGVDFEKIMEDLL